MSAAQEGAHGCHMGGGAAQEGREAAETFEQNIRHTGSPSKCLRGRKVWLI